MNQFPYTGPERRQNLALRSIVDQLERVKLEMRNAIQNTGQETPSGTVMRLASEMNMIRAAHLLEQRAEAIELIDQLDRKAQRDEHTDTGEVWEVLYSLRAYLRRGSLSAEDKVVRQGEVEGVGYTVTKDSAPATGYDIWIKGEWAGHVIDENHAIQEAKTAAYERARSLDNDEFSKERMRLDECQRDVEDEDLAKALEREEERIS